MSRSATGGVNRWQGARSSSPDAWDFGAESQASPGFDGGRSGVGPAASSADRGAGSRYAGGGGDGGAAPTLDGSRSGVDSHAPSEPAHGEGVRGMDQAVHFLSPEAASGRDGRRGGDG